MALIEPALDWQQLHNLSGNDAAFEQELLQMFIDDTEEQLAQLDVAVAANDRSLACHIAHHIKGAAANVGAMAISHQSAQLESRLTQAEPPLSAPEVSHLWQQIRPALEQLKNSL